MKEDITRAVRRFYDEVLNKGNMAAMDEIIGPDFTDHTPAEGTGADAGSLRTQIETWRRAFPDLRVTVDDIIADGERLAVRISWRGTHEGDFMGVAPSGRHVQTSAVDILSTRDGRITEAWHYGGEAVLAQLNAA
jgi:steroid delta-isomerase-like uncharacterized protein